MSAASRFGCGTTNHVGYPGSCTRRGRAGARQPVPRRARCWTMGWRARGRCRTSAEGAHPLHSPHTSIDLLPPALPVWRTVLCLGISRRDPGRDAMKTGPPVTVSADHRKSVPGAPRCGGPDSRQVHCACTYQPRSFINCNTAEETPRRPTDLAMQGVETPVV